MSVDILIWQAGIAIAIFGMAIIFGWIGLIVVVSGAILWTFDQVKTNQLFLIQFATIYFATTYAAKCVPKAKPVQVPNGRSAQSGNSVIWTVALVGFGLWWLLSGKTATQSIEVQTNRAENLPKQAVTAAPMPKIPKVAAMKARRSETKEPLPSDNSGISVTHESSISAPIRSEPAITSACQTLQLNGDRVGYEKCMLNYVLSIER